MNEICNGVYSKLSLMCEARRECIKFTNYLKLEVLEEKEYNQEALNCASLNTQINESKKSN